MLAQFQERLLRLKTRFSPAVLKDGTPRLVRETFERYDRIRGFGDYLAYCQRQCRRDIPRQTTPLHDEHIEVLRLLSPEEAAEIREEATRRARGMIFKRGADNRGILDIADEDFHLAVLEKIISPQVEARMLRYFGSEFVPYWYCFQETRPHAQESRAFCWHCDKGPGKWLKILLYFTDSAETGGNTLVLDKDDSAAVAATGYTFGPVSDRTGDVEELARLAGRPLKPLRLRIRPGEAVLFEPARLLHKGQLPDKAPRFIMQILFLPSPVPWREGLERLQRAQLPERADFAFPTHANRLKAVLG